jgi:transcriptional regulator with XRE-family HTH domain
VQRFGEKVHTLRAYRGMTVRELAQALGYTAHSYVGDVENGKRRPTADFVLKVALLFGVSTDVLMRDDLDLELPPPDALLE